MTALNSSPVGREQTVKWIIGSVSETDSIRGAGITEGCRIMVVGNYFGNVIVAVGGSRFALGNELAFRVKVG